MKKLFTLCLLVFSLSVTAQWQQTGSKVRYVNGLGIPTKDTAAGVAADSSQIVIRPQDSALYVKYKRTWLRVGGGGGSIAGSGTTNYIPKFTSSSAIGNSQIFDNGTNVGIGTTSPATDLQISRAGSSTIRLTNTNNTTNVELGIATALGFVGTNTDNSFAINTNNTERLRVTNTGNVGIGTTSPTQKLTVSGQSILLENGTNDVNYITGISGYGMSLTYATGLLRLRTNNVDRLNITNSGDVGIGTASPATRLHLLGAGTEMRIESNTSSDGFIRYINTSGSMSFGMSGAPTNTMLLYDRTNNHNAYEYLGGASGRHSWYTTNVERMRITSGGNALIGTTTDNGTDRLQVSGSASVTSLLGVGTSPSAGTVHIKTTSPSIAIDDNDNAGTAAIRFRPQSASFATKGSIELVSTGSAAPTRFVIASTDTMTFRTNSIERMRITSAGGNVLISTTTDNNTDKLQVNGSIQGTGFNQAYTAKTGTYTATTSDYFIDCTSGTFTVNLFTAVGNTGRILIIKNSGTGTITVDPNGTQTIDGATTQSLSTQYSRVHIISDGANWKIISN